MKAPTSGWRWGQRSRGRSQRRATSRVFGTTGAGPARHSSSICQPQTSARLLSSAGSAPGAFLTLPREGLCTGTPALTFPLGWGFPSGAVKAAGAVRRPACPRPTRTMRWVSGANAEPAAPMARAACVRSVVIRKCRRQRAASRLRPRHGGGTLMACSRGFAAMPLLCARLFL